MLLPVSRNATPSPTKSTRLRGVATPRKMITVPTIYNTRGTPNNCLTKTPEKSASLEPFVTRIPVDREMRSDGIWETSPSPIVRSPNCWIASLNPSPILVTPMIVPPIRLIKVMIRPAVASPFTYFVAPSMAPKKLDSR